MEILRPYISEAYVSDLFGYTESTIENNGQSIIEMILEGEYQRAGKPNKNKRIYEESLLSRETSKLQETIKQRNGLLGGLDHPIPNVNDPIPQQMQIIKRISLQNACMIHTMLEMHNGVVYGKAKVLTGDGSNGDKLAAMVRHKFKPAISSRGLGGDPIPRGDGYLYVPESFSLITFDAVCDPSTHNAILEQVIQEEVYLMEQSTKHTRKLWDVLIELSNKY